MTKHEFLAFISENNEVTVEEAADKFNYSMRSAAGYLATMNQQGLIRKHRDSDGRIVYELGVNGRKKLDYFGENGCRDSRCSICDEIEIENEDFDLDENESKEIKREVSKMKKPLYYDGVFVCEECSKEWELTHATADELKCDCGGALVSEDEFDEDEDDFDEDEPIRRGRR